MNFRILITAAVLLAGCGRNDINVYIVPKEAPPAPEPTTANAAPVRWATPAGWEPQQAGDFRVASFKLTGAAGAQADVSIVPLPGEAGGDFSNVNRWRNQVGLPPVSETDFATLGQPVEIAGQPGKLYEQDGESSSILAAIQVRDGTTWFYKMTGAPALVTEQKPVFVAFLKSIQFQAAPAAAPSAEGTPQWNPPAGWAVAPAGQFLVAKFTVAGGAAAVNISTAPGDGGGVMPNVNRWRKQLGLEPATDATGLQEIETAAGRATVAEMNGEKAALVGVIVALPDRAWFYKLMGDAGAVSAHKAEFLQFVREVKY